MGPISSPETSALNHLTTRSNPEDRIIHFSRDGSRRSRKCGPGGLSSALLAACLQVENFGGETGITATLLYVTTSPPSYFTDCHYKTPYHDVLPSCFVIPYQ
jgi:hypothetical protein